jgi:CRISPR-associated protein Cas1
MSGHHNTLYVMTQGAYLSKDHENVRISVSGEAKTSIPFHHLSSILCLGRISMSPQLMGSCAEKGIEISFCTEHGRFLARIEGPWHGGSVLRRSQYKASEDPATCLTLARSFVLGKLSNSRVTLARATREDARQETYTVLNEAAASISARLPSVKTVPTLDGLRGEEGNAAAVYFGVFDSLITHERATFSFQGRNRRPPLDPMNAILSFLYSMLCNDATSALQAVGLDPAIGFLHTERPGRASLALDLMEEFRSFLADRLALTLVNKERLRPSGFIRTETGAVEMDDETRKTIVKAYQDRKSDPIQHPFTSEDTTIGMLIHIQARLLARAIRGDLDAYPPFCSKT